MLNFKPLIFAVMCIFALSACKNTTASQSVDYPITASYENTFLKDHSRQSNSNDSPLNNPFLFTVSVAASMFLIGSIAYFAYTVSSLNRQ